MSEVHDRLVQTLQASVVQGTFSDEAMKHWQAGYNAAIANAIAAVRRDQVYAPIFSPAEAAVARIVEAEPEWTPSVDADFR